MGRPQKPVDQISKAAIRKRAQRAKSLNGESCSKCGSRYLLDRHHADYTKPEEVLILCRACHRKEDVADGTWKAGAAVGMRICKICKQPFHPSRSRRAVLCGDPACLSENGRLSAEKRWKTEPTDLGKSETASSPSRLQWHLSSLCGAQQDIEKAAA